MFSKIGDIKTPPPARAFRVFLWVRLAVLFFSLSFVSVYSSLGTLSEIGIVVTWIWLFYETSRTLRGYKAEDSLSAYQLSIDPIFIGLVNYLIGTQFSFLFPLFILYSSHFYSRKASSFSVFLCIAINILLNACRIPPGAVPFNNTSTSFSSSLFGNFGLSFVLASIWYSVTSLRQILEREEKSSKDSARIIVDGNSRYEALLETIPDPIITIDSSGCIEQLNPAAQALFGDDKDRKGKLADEYLQRRLPGFRPLRSVVNKRQNQTEYTLEEGGEPKKHFLCYQTKVFSVSGDHRGWILLFRETTALREAEERSRVEAEYRNTHRRSDLVRLPVIGTAGLVGESKLFQKVLDLVRRVAASDATVLLNGESGTGKELIARTIHQQSKWAHGPFVAVNCGAIPASLIESQLFGHKKGAFTGATTDHIGFFREATNGTLFLDEIGELPLSVQATLLRALQERTVRPVGGSSDISVNVRIIAATNKNLRRESESGRFREDLYYRLNVVTITIPPLRERREDLPLLIGHFLRQLQRQEGGELPELASETLRLLVSYRYPGNIRELENIIHRAVVLGGSLILPEHLPEQVQATEQRLRPRRDQAATHELPCDLDSILATIERDYVIAALDRSGGARKPASELLGLNLRSLRYRMQKFGLEGDRD